MLIGGMLQSAIIHHAQLQCFHCRGLTTHQVVGFIHRDGQRFMPTQVFDAWKKERAQPGEAEEWRPVVQAGNHY